MNASVMLVVFLLCGCVFTEGVPVYVYRGNPYQGPGPLPVGVGLVETREGGSPLRTWIFYPQRAGSYAPVFFVPGLDGVFPAHLYTNFLSLLASHGFVVSGSDYIHAYNDMPMDSPRRLQFITDDYTAQLIWLQSHLNPWLQSKSSGVKVNWDFLALSAHSAGADCVHKMAANMTGNPKAVVLQGPFSATFKTPLSHSLPVLMVGTEFATHHKPFFPPCIVPGWGIDHFWTMWTPPPKVMMVIKGYGHCDIIDSASECDRYKFCLSGNNTNPAIYQEFAAGITTAFLGDYMFAFHQAARFVLDNSTMPVTVMEMKTDLNGDRFT